MSGIFSGTAVIPAKLAPPGMGVKDNPKEERALPPTAEEPRERLTAELPRERAGSISFCSSASIPCKEVIEVPLRCLGPRARERVA